MIARQYGRLTAPDVTTQLSRRSVLCLPIGSYEQHGPHLPLNTDTIIAEHFTDRLIQRHGEKYDLWSLPALPYGLALEHAWSPGTISLTLGVLAGLLDAVVGECVRATPARTVLVVNGHGGNRGLLEAALYEPRRAHGITVCVVHPSSLSTVRIDTPLPEIHAGMRETSVMLALAPKDVHLDRLPPDYTVDETQRAQLRQVVLDRGTTWPWSSAISPCPPSASWAATPAPLDRRSGNRSSTARWTPASRPRLVDTIRSLTSLRSPLERSSCHWPLKNSPPSPPTVC